MMLNLSDGDRLALLDSLIDYRKMLLAGLSIDCPVPDERQERISAVRRFVDALTVVEEITSGTLGADTSGDDRFTRRNDEKRDDEYGHQRIDRGHSGEGVDSADRGDPTFGREIPDSLGGEANLSPPIDGED